jgi:hypothetical protein
MYLGLLTVMSKRRKGGLAIALMLVIVLLAPVLFVLMPRDKNGSAGIDEIGPSLTVLKEGEQTLCRNTTSDAIVCSSSDSSDVIQYALIAITDGGTVQVEKGEYAMAKPVDVPSDARLLGAGSETVFRSAATACFRISESSNVSLNNFTMVGSGGILVASYKAPSLDIAISNITATLDNRSEGAYYVLATDGKVSNVSFVRCSALNCGTNGFINNGRPGSGMVENVSYDHCAANGNGLMSRYNDWVVGFDLAERVDVNNISVRDCEATDNWQSGFHFEPIVSVTNATLVDCRADNNGRSMGAPEGQGYGWGYVINSQVPQHDIRLEGCTATGNYRGDTSLGPLSEVRA